MCCIDISLSNISTDLHHIKNSVSAMNTTFNNISTDLSYIKEKLVIFENNYLNSD